MSEIVKKGYPRRLRRRDSRAGSRKLQRPRRRRGHRQELQDRRLPQGTCAAQYLNVGIAEQNAAGVAAGLATCGKIPFVVTYAAFGSMRMVEMIRQEICYPHLNVKIACSHGGVTPANDGASHQCIEDMGILSTIPNMNVIMPADYYAARKLVRAAAELPEPVYLRFTRDAIRSYTARMTSS